jgi:hypothetical protein
MPSGPDFLLGGCMSRADYTVRDLVGKIESGELRLPEMQRDYVWTATRVRDLLDSLYRGYPSGVILAWESDEKVDTRDFAVAASSGNGIRPLLLLDGQQRLTSLSAVLRGEPVTVRNRKRPIDILFNLEHPDELTFVTDVQEDIDDDRDQGSDSGDLDIQERFKRMTFVVTSRALESLPQWVKVTDIFNKTDAELLPLTGLSGWDDDRYQKYTDRLKAVRAIVDYQYRMDILERTKSYEEVTEIFVRVNSLGAKLRSSDLALAQITAKWRGSLDVFRAYQEQLAGRGFDLDLGIVLKTLIALITSQSRFLTVNSLSQQDLANGWERTTKAMDYALNFIEANVRIDSTALLSSPFLIVTTAYWADKSDYQLDSEAVDAYRKWFLIANARGRYSRGSSESYLDQDIAVLRDGGDSSGLTQRLTQQFGRLEFSPDELVGRTSRSGAFKTMFLAFRQDQAKDWVTHLEISPKHSGKSDAIEYHHIFPKAYLKKVRSDIDRASIDDIANLAFIGSTTNKQIRDKAPSIYRHDFANEDFDSQQISFSDGLDSADLFESFVTRRRSAISLRLNGFLGLSETNQ